jgi:hypothetical protein
MLKNENERKGQLEKEGKNLVNQSNPQFES